MPLTEEDTKIRQMLKCMLMAGLRQAYPEIQRESLAGIVLECGEIMKKEILKAYQQAGANSCHELTLCSKEPTVGFWCLPPKVRTDIYKLAMKPDRNSAEDHATYQWQDDRPCIILQSECADKYGWDPDLEATWWLQPAITKVCRQIRSEALPLYYGTTEFAVYGSGFSEQFDGDVERRLEHIGEHRKLIERFSVLYKDILQHDGEETEELLKKRTIDRFADDQSLGYEVPGVPRSSIKVFVLRDVEETEIIEVPTRTLRSRMVAQMTETAAGATAEVSEARNDASIRCFMSDPVAPYYRREEIKTWVMKYVEI